MPEKVLMEFTIEHDRESDGRWIADIPALPGTMAYGSTAEQARAQALALRVVAERLEHDKAGAESMTISFRAA
jgi:predicted RNase H-like HicB family nuclease